MWLDVMGGRNSESTPAQSPDRYVPYFPTVSAALGRRQQKCSLSFRFDLTQSPHQLDVINLAFVKVFFFGFLIGLLYRVDFCSSHKAIGHSTRFDNHYNVDQKTFEQHET